MLGSLIAATLAGLDLISINPQTGWTSLLFILLIYPVLEEISFRGALQSTLLSLTWGQRAVGAFTAANLVTSLLFALCHLLVQSQWLLLSVMIPSLLFGWVRERYRSLFAPMLLHISFNSALFLF